MKIILCENSRDADKTARLLDRNLPKVKIIVKECPEAFEKYKDSQVVAKVDGKLLLADNAYGLLKEIRKFLKKEDKTDLLDEAEMKKAKKDHKAQKEHKEHKEHKKNKDHKNGEKLDEKLKKNKLKKEQPGKEQEETMDKDQMNRNESEVMGDKAEIKATIQGDRIVLDAPNEQFSLDDMKISVNFGKFGQENSTYEVLKDHGEEIGASIKGDKVVLNVPNENFRLEDMKISVNLGSFGDRNSTYEVVKEGKENKIDAELHDDEIVLNVPNEQFSLDKMRLTVNFGTFGEQNSTYEVVKSQTIDEEKIRALKEEKKNEETQVMTFSAPEPKETKS